MSSSYGTPALKIGKKLALRMRHKEDAIVMLVNAVDEQQERGCYKVMLQTGSKKESTHAYYRACGFSGDDKKGYVARPPR